MSTQLIKPNIPKHQTSVFPKLLFAIYTDTYYISRKEDGSEIEVVGFWLRPEYQKRTLPYLTNYFLLLRTKSFFLPNTLPPPSTSFTESPKENLEEPKAINGTGSGFLQS